MNSVSALNIYSVATPGASTTDSVAISPTMHPDLGPLETIAVRAERVVPNWNATFARRGLPPDIYYLAHRTSIGPMGCERLTFEQYGPIDSRFQETVVLRRESAIQTGLQGDVFNVGLSEPVLRLQRRCTLPTGEWGPHVEALFRNRLLISDACTAQILRRFRQPGSFRYVDELVEDWRANGGYLMTPADLLLYSDLY